MNANVTPSGGGNAAAATSCASAASVSAAAAATATTTATTTESPQSLFSTDEMLEDEQSADDEEGDEADEDAISDARAAQRLSSQCQWTIGANQKLIQLLAVDLDHQSWTLNRKVDEATTRLKDAGYDTIGNRPITCELVRRRWRTVVAESKKWNDTRNRSGKGQTPLPASLKYLPRHLIDAMLSRPDVQIREFSTEALATSARESLESRSVGRQSTSTPRKRTSGSSPPGSDSLKSQVGEIKDVLEHQKQIKEREQSYKERKRDTRSTQRQRAQILFRHAAEESQEERTSLLFEAGKLVTGELDGSGPVTQLFLTCADENQSNLDLEWFFRKAPLFVRGSTQQSGCE
eukprot:gb/GECG01010901.1/.p1 GENE.gb/GECG01010901.1/~~gb/GECG01010901.1/.p1  ORF type:complete len:348 (+),score=51.84 gb/GECG01010901.1/:1-1044(+)